MKKTFVVAMVAALGTVPAALASATDVKPSPRADILFWMLDRNSDGFIDQAEIQAFRTATFIALDSNGDGVLSKEEAQAGFPQIPAAASADADRATRISERQNRMLMRIGFKDGVASVTKADYLARSMPMFNRADTDHDGKLSKAEFEAAAARFRSFMIVR